VCRGAIRRSEPPGRQELVLAHEAQHALAADGQAPVGQARPHFTIAFAWNGVVARTSRIAATSARSLVIVGAFMSLTLSF